MSRLVPIGVALPLVLAGFLVGRRLARFIVEWLDSVGCLPEDCDE